MFDSQILFQHGMSIPEFLACFGTDAQCAETAKRAPWPDGFRCSGSKHHAVGHGARKLFQCNGCRHQTSLTAGSPLEHTKLPLTTWPLAIYLVSQSKIGSSALALKHQLGVSYPTAWLLHQKIDGAMAQRHDTALLSGARQFDHARLESERVGGKAGRGSENKVPAVAAVSLNDKGHPLYLELNLVSGFTSQAIRKWASAPLVRGAWVTSDGLGCFAAGTNGGFTHPPAVVGALKPRELPQFKWVNIVLRNLKTTLAGAFHSLNYRKYAGQYLCAFASRFNHRFNHRFDLRSLVARAIVDVVRSRPAKEEVVRIHAETSF